MLTLNAPAKINWFLAVLGKRADGYHDILSLLQSVSLYDTLTFEESDSLRIVSDLAIRREENLVYRAAVVIGEAAGYSGEKRGARITLKKTIPVSAGLGGGSSDAASTLMGLNSLWGLDLKQAELSLLAARLGSDVPFFLSGPSAMIESRGEIVTPVRINKPYTVLLVKPTGGVSSAAAYSAIKRYSPQSLDTGAFLRALEEGDFASLRGRAWNDLEEAVFERHPEVRQIKEKILKRGALFGAMSGSGSAVFGVFEDRPSAARAALEFPDYWTSVVETLV